MGAPIGIFTSSPEGRYLSVNPAMARIFGYESPQALIDASSETESDIPVDTAGGDTFLRLLDIQDEIFDRETRHLRRDGSEVWVSTSARAVRDDSGKTSHFLGFVTEITPRKQVEAALAHERNLYRDLVASQPAGVSGCASWPKSPGARKSGSKSWNPTTRLKWSATGSARSWARPVQSVKPARPSPSIACILRTGRISWPGTCSPWTR